VLCEQRPEGGVEVLVLVAEDLLRLTQRLFARLSVVVEPFDGGQKGVELVVGEP